MCENKNRKYFMFEMIKHGKNFGKTRKAKQTNLNFDTCVPNSSKFLSLITIIKFLYFFFN